MSGPALPQLLVIGASNRDTKCKIANAMQKQDESHIGTVITSNGGVGRNIAEVLGRLHCKVGLITAVGDDDYSNKLLQDLTDHGVTVTQSLQFRNLGPDSYVAIHDCDGELISAVNQMTLVERIDPQVIETNIEYVRHAKIIIADCNLREDTLMKIVETKGDGKLAIDGVSMAKIRKITSILPAIDVLKVNRAEASLLIDEPETTPAQHMISQLRAKGVSQILLSDGNHGFFINEGSVIKHFRAEKATPETVSGAGDCLFAGYLFGVFSDSTLTESARYAIRAAALSTRSISAVNNHITLQQLLA